MASNDLRARLDAALRPAMLIGLYERLGEERAGEWADWVLEAVLAVRDAELETARRERDEAEAAIARVRRLCELTIAASCRAQAIDQARDTLAALDSPEAPR